MALCRRTQCRRPGRSFSCPTRSQQLRNSPSRTRSPRPWWRRRGRRSCERLFFFFSFFWGWNSLRLVWRGRLHASTLPVFLFSFICPSCESTQNAAEWWGSKQRRLHHLCNLGRLYLGIDDPRSLRQIQPSAAVNVQNRLSFLFSFPFHSHNSWYLVGILFCYYHLFFLTFFLASVLSSAFAQSKSIVLKGRTGGQFPA